jgi:hypothetical protein
MMPFRRKCRRAIDSRARPLSFEESTVNFQRGRPRLCASEAPILRYFARRFCLRMTREPRPRHRTAQQLPRHGTRTTNIGRAPPTSVVQRKCRFRAPEEADVCSLGALTVRCLCNIAHSQDHPSMPSALAHGPPWARTATRRLCGDRPHSGLSCAASSHLC